MNSMCSVLARRAAIVILAAFGIALPQIAVAQSDPLVGTWNLVPDKSTFMPGPAPYKSMTLTFADPGQMNVDGVDAEGNPVKGSYATVADGKPHPITGVEAVDSGMWSRFNDSSTSYRYLKGRAIMTVGTRVLSPDGKTLTFHEQNYDRNGKQISTSVLVFDNPNVKVASVTPKAAATPEAPQSALTADETAAAAALAKGDDDEAIRIFTKAIDEKQSTTMLPYDHVSRGIAYARKGQNDQAFADFDAAVKLKPDDVDARFRRGGMRVQLEQYQAAIDDLSAVVQADAMNAAAYRLRAFSYSKLGDDKNAGADYDKACSLNKQFCL